MVSILEFSSKAARKRVPSTKDTPIWLSKRGKGGRVGPSFCDAKEILKVINGDNGTERVTVPKPPVAVGGSTIYRLWR